MILVRDVLERDPIGWSIPNDGVAKVGMPTTQEEWEVLRYELRSFVVEGEYEAGLDRVLKSFLSHLDHTSQPAAWVSGFFGSGKSHLLKALASLWSDFEFPDGARASGLVDLTSDIEEKLAELKTRSIQFGGRFAAAGALDAGGTSAALSILSVVFAALGLPTSYPAARLVLWLRKDRLLDAVNADLHANGRTLAGELLNMYVSDHLARAILAAKPDFAANTAEVRKSLRDQYPSIDDLERDRFVEVVDDTLRVTHDGQVPLTLLVLDELQLFLNDDPGKTWEMQQLVEAMCSKLGSRLLVVGAGQMALRATANLQRLQDRFTVEVALRDADVDRVVRSVVLRKKPAKEAQVAAVLDKAKGEVSRQFAGSAIAAAGEDDAYLVADYPLLPVRRRLWDAIVRAIDTGGRSTKLRTRLRDVLDATKGVAERELGAVVAIDAIYDEKRDEFLGTPTLSRDTDELISGLNDGTDEGGLKSRIAKVAFLFERLPRDGAKPTGVSATDDMLIDALISDLRTDRATLDPRVRSATAAMAKDAILSNVNGEFRLRNTVDAEWQAEFDLYRRELEGDAGWIAGQRGAVIEAALATTLKGFRPVQGVSKVGRKYRFFFGPNEPTPQEDEVAVWVQTGWDDSEKSVIAQARAAGTTSSRVFVFVPRARSADIGEAIVTAEAGERTVTRKASPTTPEGISARAAIASRRDVARQAVIALAAEVVLSARVWSAGGAEVLQPASGPTVAGSVESAVQSAILRLYPDFSLADSAAWPKVIEAVAKGNANPLSAVGHVGEPDKHPVVKAILGAIPPAGKRGQELRKLFGAPTFGWPQDAVDASLLVLTLADRVEAIRNGAPVTVKQMPQNVIGSVEFRPQGVVVSMSDRLAVRGLAQFLGHQIQGRDDFELTHLVLGSLSQLAEAAGGEAPLPPRPSKERIHDLDVLAGNAQLVALAAAKAEIEGLVTGWKATKELIPSRTADWVKANRLLAHAGGLPHHDAAQAALAAIQASRTLLADPDPLSSVLTDLADALRAKVDEHEDTYATALHAAIKGLEREKDWQALGPEDSETILRAQRLDGGIAPEVGTVDELLAALDAAPLGDWQFRIQAVPAQAGAALAQAAAKNSPPPVEIRRGAAIIHDEAELESYLEGLRQAVRPHLAEHRTVIV